MKNISFAVWTALVSLLSATHALAAQPLDWQWRFQPAATAIMEEITWFEAYTLWFIVPITLFVLALIVICAVKFRRSVNPVPSKTSHNTLIEVVWTVAPVVILLFLAVPSFQLLSAQYDPPEDPALTIKATGYQWYWGYEYQASDDVAEGEEPTEVVFDSLLLQDDARADAGKEDLSAYPRLLAVNNEVVVPVNQTVRLLVTAGDVLHSFAMPAFGIKIDAVPGRLNETWFKAEREGLYYGQCSELCGKDHAFMPIAIRVVSEEQYNEWATAATEDVGAANRQLMAAIEAETAVDVANNNAQ
ncbi:cytochrome c oxidase subunit II [Pararhizobium haloflavum]|uniref:cytochrome c oxidase subunit II n=1 Tax=Pararhizobium haloflavum TaxID=2037914 RepID=UPI000C18D4D4|nr:cytochrome c oxidase subunit II [Pararhizobium haloflavum]